MTKGWGVGVGGGAGGGSSPQAGSRHTSAPVGSPHGGQGGRRLVASHVAPQEAGAPEERPRCAPEEGPDPHGDTGSGYNAVGQVGIRMAAAPASRPWGASQDGGLEPRPEGESETVRRRQGHVLAEGRGREDGQGLKARQ